MFCVDYQLFDVEPRSFVYPAKHAVAKQLFESLTSTLASPTQAPSLSNSPFHIE